MAPKFDPFNDRFARDIRNGLSAALVESLPELDQVAKVRDTFLGDDRLLPHHKAYINERFLRYQAVQEVVTKYQLGDIACRSLAMWDEQLFFEVHECLEGEWYPAPAGDRKKALQALICAAGTFVHLERGNKKGAGKMSARALKGLNDFGHALPELGAALQTLISCMTNPTTPPRILSQTECGQKP